MPKIISCAVRAAVFFIVGVLLEPSYSEEVTVIPEVDVQQYTAIKTTPAARAQATHFTRKEIKKNPAVTLGKLFQQQSVVRLTNNSGDNSQTEVSIRGFGDNAVANALILVDGFPFINPTLTPTDFNSILLSDIERVDIFEGSEGTLWGNQAVGGVVNIITRHPEKLFGNVTASYGSYNSKYLNAIIGDKLDNGIFFKISGYTDQTDNYRHHNQQANEGVSSQLGIDYSSGSLTFIQRAYNNSIQFPGALSEAQFNSNPRLAIDLQDHMYNEMQIYQLLSKQEINNDWLLETRVAHNDARSNGFFYSPFYDDQWLSSVNPQLVGDLHNHKLIFGYYAQASGYKDVGGGVFSRVRMTQKDVYAQDVIQLNSQWDLTLGSRAAWQDNNPEIIVNQPIHYINHIFVTEQGLHYYASSVWSFFVRRDGNFRLPKANEEVYLPLNATTLRAQTGVSYEMGAERQTERQSLQFNIYHLQLNNEIAYDPTQTALQPFGATSNLDRTLRDGITITDRFRLNTMVDFNSQLNYVRARFDSGPYSGNVIPTVPAWTASEAINYQMTPHWKTTYTALYISSSYASNDVANISKKSRNYLLIMLALQYLFKHGSLGLQIDNLFDQRYARYTVYDVVTHSNFYYPASGRCFLLTAKLNLE